ncbi:MAG: agmatine deiminase family protein [candidate division KSB1 bacterium]|nr:agmatine deiminase family protein [candidate division KSB1 bacterium]MDZ7276537.1 agmatine deiminase family protein [candidate division KSB1 bacterium]MDZ7285045.1 agmatine deiminase family protein [candidate division KSB1 bacterium]MDZ7298077.1 agmatine deiminase family protein [candidate division KSB1 bacterium]MDZ7307701.1 agmatine deiminase family protein [candidate division KSB1 bacterium]
MLLLPALLLTLAGSRPSLAQAKIRLQSAHAGEIKKLLLVYTWSAEMGVLSLADILTALPEAEAVILSQFAPGSESFRVFTASLTRGGLGRDRHGRPRLQFVQDASAYGPWPRDQALVDSHGTLWISPSDNHRLRAIFTALDESYGLRQTRATVPFTGANLIPLGNLVLCPDRLDTLALASFLQGPFLPLPSPPPPDPFHLDLLVMPLSETVIAVGDDELARARLLALNAAQERRILAQWAVEFAASGHNLEVKAAGNTFRFQTLPRPYLILPALLQEKLQILTELAKPGAFRTAVLAEPEYHWDDRIAAALRRRGFKVVRVPFWPGTAGTVASRKAGGLPMLCYANCLVWEKGVLMPVYGIASLDQLARDTLSAASGKPVFAVRGGALLGYGNSGPHCLTLEFRR